jgi:hypothetical protein
MPKNCDQCSQRRGRNYFYSQKSLIKNVRLCDHCHGTYDKSDDMMGHKENHMGKTLYTSVGALIFNEVTRRLE